MANVKSTSSSLSSGCLALFALPFAAVGVGMGVWLASTILTYLNARSWVEAPARIVRTELKVQRDRKSTTYEVTAEYVYTYGDRKYTGHRVGLLSGADIFGSFQQDAYRQLSACQKAGKPVPCYVNPARPEEAILYRDMRWEMAAFQMIFVLAFGGIGFGLLIGGLIAYGKGRANSALAVANPDAPWMWKADWAAGRIVSSSKASMLGLLSFAAFWNIVSAPLWFVLPGEIIDKGNRFALLGLLFPVVGLLLVWGAIVAILRWYKFGQSVFQMAAVPGVIGGQLAGVIRTSAKVRPEDGFQLTLACIRRITTGSGKQRSTSEEAVWEAEQIVAHELLDDMAEQSAIPVVFPIPYECLPTDETVADRQTLWRLKAAAKVPGIDYSATFEVPVFKTADSDPNFAAEGQPLPQYAAPAAPERELHEAGVRKMVAPDGEGVRLVFPMARNLGGGLFFTVFWLIWTGAIVFMLHVGAPLLFPIVFGLFDAIIFLILIDLWFYRSLVDVSPRGLSISGGLFGLGPTRRIEAADVQKFETKRSVSSGQNVYYNLVVVPGSGKPITIGKGMPGRRLATVVIRQIEQAMNRAPE